MKDIFLLEKAKEERKLLENITDTSMSAKMASITTLIDLTPKYK